MSIASSKTKSVIFLSILLLVAFLIAIFLWFKGTQNLSKNAFTEVSAATRLSEVGFQYLYSPLPLPEAMVYGAQGDEHALSGLLSRDNITIINFWEENCIPCLVELQAFGNIKEELAASGIKIVALNFGTDKKAAADFLAENKLDIELLLIKEADFAHIIEALDIVSTTKVIPQSLLVLNSGNVLANLLGAINWQAPGTLSALKTISTKF